MPAHRPGDWIDATVPFGHAAATWPGDAAFESSWTARLASHGVNLSRFASSPHNGTHGDAPYHVDEAGAKSEALPLGNFLGPCRVVDATDARGPHLLASLAPKDLARGQERILFKTRRGVLPRAFPRDFKGLGPGLAKTLARARVRLVGTDAPSVDRPDPDGLLVHRTLFAAGASILESLDLHRVRPGRYELVALPLKVEGLCGAPVRALLRRLGPGREEPRARRARE